MGSQIFGCLGKVEFQNWKKSRIKRSGSCCLLVHFWMDGEGTCINRNVTMLRSQKFHFPKSD